MRLVISFPIFKLYLLIKMGQLSTKQKSKTDYEKNVLDNQYQVNSQNKKFMTQIKIRKGGTPENIILTKKSDHKGNITYSLYHESYYDYNNIPEKIINFGCVYISLNAINDKYIFLHAFYNNTREINDIDYLKNNNYIKWDNIGVKLLHFVIDDLIGLGYKKIIINANSESTAEWYQRIGLQKCSTKFIDTKEIKINLEDNTEYHYVCANLEDMSYKLDQQDEYKYNFGKKTSLKKKMRKPRKN